MEESEFTLALNTVEQIRKMKYEMYRYDDRTEAYRLLVDIVKQVFTEYEKKHVISAVNEPNDYHGPQTGYQMTEERLNEINDIPWAVNPEDY